MAGLDVGTSFIVLSKEVDGNIQYKDFRDAFYVIKPTTPVATKMIEKGLANKVFIKDSDGSFILLGKDAIEKAIERNDTAKRPMYRGVVSAKEKDAKKILAFILKEVVGQASEPGEKLVFCIPAQPVDQDGDDFDVGYHEDVVKTVLSECGYDAKSINEAEALCYAELENDDYTGIAISCGAGMTNVCVMLNGEPTVTFSTTKCLSKDTLISTTEGLKKISKVEKGDFCYDNRGELSEVMDVLNNGKRSKMLKIKAEGYSEPIICTEDHKIWIKKYKDINWGWIPAENININDNIGFPIIKPLSESIASHSIYFYREKDSNVYIPKSRNLGRFLGYFLGDGSAYTITNKKSDGRVTCSFNIKHKDYDTHRERYKEIVKELFNKDIYEENRDDESCCICRFNSIKLAKRLKKLCYSDNIKQLNIPINQISNQMALGLIEGLLATDGWRCGNHIGFENSSSSLCILLQNLLARFGIKSLFTVRKPRKGGKNNKGEVIQGKLDIFNISIRNNLDVTLLDYLYEQADNAILTTTSMDYLQYRVSHIEEVEYNDNVYDLVMQNKSVSFCCPAGALHNSGDWIDRMTAVATGEPDSVVQVEKEGGGFVIGEPNENPVLAAVSAYYERLIDYTTKNLAVALANHKSLPKFKEPLSIVVAGGTSQAAGYVENFRQKLEENGFPLPVKEVRHASDPLHAVSKGCLIASQVL